MYCCTAGGLPSPVPVFLSPAGMYNNILSFPLTDCRLFFPAVPTVPFMITLRSLSRADIPEIKGWSSYPPEFAMLDYCHKDGGWLDTYGKDEKNAVFVAADGGGIVGFSLLLEEKSASPEFMVALRPDRLGNGLGRTVARLTLECGFSRPGTRSIRLIVRRNNFRAQALYAALGFCRTGEMTKEVQGVPVDFFCMEISREEFFKGEG